MIGNELRGGPILRLAGAAEQAINRLNPLHGRHFPPSPNLPETDRVNARMPARPGGGPRGAAEKPPRN